MIKYFYRLMLVVFLIVGGMQAYAAKAPANASIATQASLTYTDVNSTQQSVSSNIVSVTVNPVYSLTVAPGITSSAFAGETISFPTKITNNSNIDTAIAVYLASGNQLSNVTYTVDTNGNGVLDAGETTVLTNSTIPVVNLPGAMTPVVPIGGEIALIVTGTISPNAVPGATEQYIVHARILVDGKDIVEYKPTSYLIKTPANVVITKTIEQTATPGLFDYVFSIVNNAPTAASNIVLTDTLSSNVTLVGEGFWVPVGYTMATGKYVPESATGYEVISDDIDYSVVNGLMTLKVKSIPANHTTANGAILKVRVQTVPGLAGGTVITNTANYTFDNGAGVNVAKATNSAIFTLPSIRTVTLNADLTKDLIQGAVFNLPQTIQNTGNTADTYTLSLTNATYVENPVFYLDDNGDGIRQITETTVITESTVVQPGQSFKFFISGRWSVSAPANTTFTAVATSKGDTNISDTSLITVTSIAAGQTVLLTSDLTLNSSSGAEVVIPQTLSNTTGVADTFTLSIQEANDIFTSIKYFADDNGDGVRQPTEITEYVGGITPSVANNGTLKFFAVVTLKQTVTAGAQTFRIYANANNLATGVDWSAITLNITQAKANVTVVKSIGPTGVVGAYVYVFDIKNTGSIDATNLVLTDNIPTTVEPDITTGVWIPFGATAGKSVTNAADGYEALSNEVDFSVVNNVLTLKLKTVPAGQTVGGRINLRVRPKTTTAEGTVVTNTASYYYNDGTQVTTPVNTNTVTYTVPVTAKVTVEKSAQPIAGSNSFLFTFKLKNDSTTAATNFTLTDTLASSIEVDSTTASWMPIGQTVTKELPLTDTGYEVISDEIAVKVINNVLTVQLKTIQAGTGINILDGGILKLRVKAKNTTAPGTVVTNVASYTYNNGVQVTAAANTNSVNYTIPTINLVLEKFQAIDANKDLTPDAAYTKDPLTANPGEGIFYKLVATNTGTGIATNINITDTIAQYVGLSNGDTTLSTKGKPVWRVNGGAFTEITNVPAVGAAGNIVATIPTINPGDVVEIFYHVKVSE